MAPRLRQGRLVTLTSDVGSAYAAQMKAALIAGGVDPARIVDLAHDLPAHGVREAAFLVREMARSFPASSVHVVVVDPGVGGRRAPIVIATGSGPYLVGPDNGVLVPLADELGIRRAYRLDSPKRPGRRVGTTFDGRDVFAPAAAWLAGGGAPSALGRAVTVTRYSLPRAQRTPTGATGEVLHVDRFGNLVTNIASTWVPAGLRAVRVRLGRSAERTVPWVTSYEALAPRSLGALGSSFGLIELAVREGRADRHVRAGVGAAVGFAWTAQPARRGANANSARPRNPR